MKKLFLLFIFVSNALYGQDTKAKKLNRTLDSLTNIHNFNQNKIDSLTAINNIIDLERRKTREDILAVSNQDLPGETLICFEETVLWEKADGINWNTKINKGDIVKVIEVLDRRYKVIFKDLTGYVLKTKFQTETQHTRADSIMKDKNERLRLLEIEKKEELKEIDL